MEQIVQLISALNSVVDSSDSMYRAYACAPAEDSLACREVLEHDEELASTTRMPTPLFGAYVDAEFKLHLLNDLVRSFTSLVAKTDVNLGEMVIARSVIEVAARMHWGLAFNDDYRERASRWLREWLRIAETKKLGEDPLVFVEGLGNEMLIREGAASAGLNVPGPPPGTIDLVWMVMTAKPGQLRFQGLKREDVVAVFYRKLSAVTHGSMLGVHPQFADPRADTSYRSTASRPSEILTLIAGVLTAYANALERGDDLYGWDSSSMKSAIDEAVDEINTAYKHFAAP